MNRLNHINKHLTNTSNKYKENDVFIISASRTPIGGFGGALKDYSAVELGSITIKKTIAQSKIDVNDIDEAFIGNVLSANLGQAPARQAVINAGLPKKDYLYYHQ